MAERSDDAAVLELVADVVGLLDLDELRPGLLTALVRAVPAPWASLTDVGPDHVEGIVEPPLDDVWHERFARLAHENPLYQRWMRTKDGRAYRFSDVVSRGSSRPPGSTRSSTRRWASSTRSR
jgi:hypothetical protein